MIDPLFDLSERVAVVTGAASGLGKAMAMALCKHGANLMLVDLDLAGATRTARELPARGQRAIPVECDVADEAAIRSLFARLDGEYGRVDFLANVAGGEPVLGKPEDITPEQVRQAFEVLVFGRLIMCQEAGKRMLAARRGSIVNIGSLASVTALGRGHIAYSMAMGAVVQMTRELSAEWAGRGVRVNAILPAQVVNPSLEHRMAADPTLEAKWLKGIPSGRLGKPTDIQGLAVLLASDASEWITGALIPMDGGNLSLNAGGTIGS